MNESDIKNQFFFNYRLRGRGTTNTLHHHNIHHFFQLGIQTPKKTTGTKRSTVQQNSVHRRSKEWDGGYLVRIFSVGAIGLSCPVVQSSDLDEVSADRVRKVGNFISHGRGNWLPGRIVH